jgi:hypothetical protein
MSLSTDIFKKQTPIKAPVDNKQPTTKRAKSLWFKDHHKELFVKEGINYPKFIPKTSFFEKALDERVIGFSPKEIYGGKNIYLELTGTNLEVEDKNRTLYMWLYTSEYDTEYKKSEPRGLSNEKQYMIPIDELVNVSEVHAVKEEEVKNIEKVEQAVLDFKDTPTGDEDAPFTDMTIKDFASIMLRKPLSQRLWLNDLINKHK